jgi:hypothetical protein
MATSLLYRVTYAIVKAAPSNQAGQKYIYRKPTQSCHVAAVSVGGSSGILATLSQDLTLAAGETVELLSYQQEQTGDGVVYS